MSCRNESPLETLTGALWVLWQRFKPVEIYGICFTCQEPVTSPFLMCANEDEMVGNI